MASRKAGFQSEDFSFYLGEVSRKLAKNAAEEIVRGLQEEAPAWTGNYRDSFVILPGKNQKVPTKDDRPKFQMTKTQKDPKPVKAPLTKGKRDEDFDYTLGNTAAHRNIAQDLDPQNVRITNPNTKTNTAPKDWYRTFVQGGLMQVAISIAAVDTQNDPKIKNFRARKNFK